MVSSIARATPTYPTLLFVCVKHLRKNLIPRRCHTSCRTSQTAFNQAAKLLDLEKDTMVLGITKHDRNRWINVGYYSVTSRICWMTWCRVSRDPDLSYCTLCVWNLIQRRCHTSCWTSQTAFNQVTGSGKGYNVVVHNPARSELMDQQCGYYSVTSRICIRKCERHVCEISRG
jgi:hypothetical protein